MLESISGESDDQHSKREEEEEEEEHQSITTIEDDKIQIVNSTTGKTQTKTIFFFSFICLF